MSIAQAFFVVLAIAGAVSIIGLAVDFICYHRRHRNIRLDSRPQPDSRNWLDEFNRTLRP